MKTVEVTLKILLVCLAVPLMPLRAGAFDFVVIGDTRPRFESESFKPFENLIPRINAVRPALVINLGDLIYGYGPASKEKQWDKYQAVAQAIHAPYYQVPGNHDTHSKQARRIYGRRFGKFYQSFDHDDCHFVLLDNTEEQRWGYVSPAQLKWLQEDLRATRARAVFVFMHFPVWEPERITPETYRFWEQTLHPLFRSSRVQAVFGGHYHTYGPTREFDGIRYYITGGGGAELRPEYKKSGGDYHFLKVQAARGGLDLRVITERGELTDPEADLMGGLQFAARQVSRIGIEAQGQDLRTGLVFRVSVTNPYREALQGQATWLTDPSAFLLEPTQVAVDIAPGGTRDFSFHLRALRELSTLSSLPRLQFAVAAAGRRHRFHREVRFLEPARTPLRAPPPTLDGNPSDWAGLPASQLRDGQSCQAELRSCYDARMLYLLFCLPAFDTTEARELGFSDELQIGISRPLGPTDFGADRLRLGFNAALGEAKDRTPGHPPGAAVAGVKCVAGSVGGQTCYEIAIPWGLLEKPKPRAGSRIILDLSFLVAEPESPAAGDDGPPVPNSFSYRVRYGSDSLVPVHFLELNLN